MEPTQWVRTLLPNTKISRSIISFYICSFRNAGYVFKFRNMCAKEGYVTAQIQAITVLSRIQLQFLRSKLRLSGAVTSDGMNIRGVNKAIDCYCHSTLRLRLCKAAVHFAGRLGFMVLRRKSMKHETLPSCYWETMDPEVFYKHGENIQK
jgi:hypothetical protein